MTLPETSCELVSTMFELQTLYISMCSSRILEKQQQGSPNFRIYPVPTSVFFVGL